MDVDRGELLPLLPGQRPRLPFRARYDDKEIQYAFEARRIAGRVRFAMHPQLPEAQIRQRQCSRQCRMAQALHHQRTGAGSRMAQARHRRQSTEGSRMPLSPQPETGEIFRRLWFSPPPFSFWAW